LLIAAASSGDEDGGRRMLQAVPKKFKQKGDGGTLIAIGTRDTAVTVAFSFPCLLLRITSTTHY
jgi:hypothetical protein